MDLVPGDCSKVVDKCDLNVEKDGLRSQDSCPLCTSKLVLRVLGPCDHPLCHKCAIKLRALYSNMECPFCKTNLPLVVLTKDKSKTYSELVDDVPLHLDKKTGIYIDGSKAKQEFDHLLNFVCPNSNCGFVASKGWAEIKKHVDKVHRKLFCYVCLGVQKKFCGEFKLYTLTSIGVHMNRGDKDDPTFKGHPPCKFCKTRFYDAEYLSKHMKRAHEECFICVRSTSHKEEYHRDYSALEAHLQSMHFMCDRQECLERKFVVYETKKELNDHIKETHNKGYPNTQYLKKATPSRSNLIGHSKLRPKPLFDDIPGTSSAIPAHRALKMVPSSFSGNILCSATLLLSSSTPPEGSFQTTESDRKLQNLKPNTNRNTTPNPSPSVSLWPVRTETLTQEVINETFNVLTVYQQNLVDSIFNSDNASVKQFAENFAKFHTQITGASTFSQFIIDMLVSKFSGKQLRDKLEDASFLVKNLASIASSIHRGAKLCIGNMLVESWESLLSELYRTLPPVDPPNNFVPVKKSTETPGKLNAITAEMFPSLPQTSSKSDIDSINISIKPLSFSSTVKKHNANSPVISTSNISTRTSGSLFPVLHPTSSKASTTLDDRSRSVSKPKDQQKKTEFPPLFQDEQKSSTSSLLCSKPVWPHTNSLASSSNNRSYENSKKGSGSKSKIILF